MGEVRIEFNDLKEPTKLHRVNNFSSYEINSDLWAAADDFTLSLHATKEARQVFKTPGQFVQIYNAGHLQLTGRVDHVRKHVDPENGPTLDLSGRDYGAFLVDSAAPLVDYDDLSMRVVIERLIAPWSSYIPKIITDNAANRFKVSGGKADGAKSPVWRGISTEFFRKTEVEPGERVWEVIRKLAAEIACHVWMDAKGRLVVARPAYAQDPGKYAPGVIQLMGPDGEPAGGNVHTASLDVTIDERFAEYVGVGQGQANATSKGKDLSEQNAGKVIDPSPAFWTVDSVTGKLLERFAKLDVTSRRRVGSSKLLRRAIRSKMELNAVKGFTYKAEVYDHRPRPDGPLWATDTMVMAWDEINDVFGPMYVVGRNFRLDVDSGETTELTMIPPNVWLAVDHDAHDDDAYEREMRKVIYW